MFSERLKYFINHLGISITSFEAAIGVSKGAIAKPIKNQKTVGVEVLGKILIAYPQINVEWLVVGIGEMFKPNANATERTSENATLANQMIISKDEFIALQRKALRQEDRIRELEREVEELKS